MLARTDSCELPLIMGRVNLALLLNTVADQFGSLAEEKNIMIRREIAPNLLVKGDEDRLMTCSLSFNAFLLCYDFVRSIHYK